MSSPKKLGNKTSYARHRKDAGLPGGTRRAVEKAIDEGRVDVDVIVAGKYEEADQQWAEHTDATKGKGTFGRQDSKGEAPKKRASTRTLNRVQLDRAQTKARREKLSLAREEGSLVDVREVERRWFAAGQRIRDLLMAMKDTAGPELVAAVRAEDDDNRAIASVNTLLERHLRRCLSSLDGKP